MKAILLFIALTAAAFAGPPENATKHMVPFPVICTPTMTAVSYTHLTLYAVHISMTFEETPTTGVVIVQNPNTHTAAILHLTTERTCLVFSGLNMQLFVRPEGMAEPEVDILDQGQDT